MRIEVDIFSGRPNPTWEAALEEAEGIQTVLASLPAAEGAVPPLSAQLGFRGFLLFDLQNNQRVHVQGAVVMLQRGTTITAKSDPERRLQQALIRLARTHLDPDLYAFLLSQVSR